MGNAPGVTHRFGYLSFLCMLLLLNACGGGDDGGPPPAPGCGNNCPIANAGPDQEVLVGKPITLDGSQSSSPGALPLTYQWTLTEKPTGSTATLAGPTTVRPTFTADVEGTYTAKLVVASGGASSRPDTVNVTAGTGNLPPVANAGADATVPVSKLVMLDGSQSYDPNDTPVTYSWRLQSQPSNSQAVLLNPNSATPSLTPDVPGDYKISLTVSDGTLTSPPNQITITAITGNSPPIAHAGPDQMVSTGQLVTLTGAGSRDPDGDPLTYSWCLRSKPDDSTATLADATSVTPSFTPDMAGLYVLCLSVNDGKVSSDFDAVVIEARTGQPGRFNGPVTAIIVAPDNSGDIYVAGHFTVYNNQPVRPVVRLRPNGTLNETFALANSILPSGEPNQITSITGSDDGSGDFYVAEVFFSSDGSSSGRLWRVHSDGTVDTVFAMGELTRSPDPTLSFLGPVVINTVVPVGDRSGRIYVGGTFGRYNGLPVFGTVRVNRNGTLDPTFNAGPSTRVVPVEDGSGDVLVVRYVRTGISSIRPQLLQRLNQDGSVDAAFVAFNVSTSPDWTISSVQPVYDGSGDLFVGGHFVYGLARQLVRLNPDGILDTMSPKPSIDETQPVHFLAKAIDGSGDWYVVQQSEQARLNRYKSDGSIDPDFRIGQVKEDPPGSFINALLQATDGSGDLYVGGRFSSYNGVPAGNLVRIDRGGALD